MQQAEAVEQMEFVHGRWVFTPIFVSFLLHAIFAAILLGLGAIRLHSYHFDFRHYGPVYVAGVIHAPTDIKPPLRGQVNPEMPGSDGGPPDVGRISEPALSGFAEGVAFERNEPPSALEPPPVTGTEQAQPVIAKIEENSGLRQDNVRMGGMERAAILKGVPDPRTQGKRKLGKATTRGAETSGVAGVARGDGIGNRPTDLAEAVTFTAPPTPDKPKEEAAFILPVNPPSAAQKVAVKIAPVEKPESLEPLEPLNEVDVDFAVYEEPGDPQKFFRLTISLKKDAKLPVMPKDVLFVVDISLSIGPDELAQTRAALAKFFPLLHENDRFNVIVFSTDIFGCFDDFVPVTPENAQKALAFVHTRPDQVRTDVYAAVSRIVDLVPGGARPCEVVLVSDGASTYGIQAADRIVNDYDLERRKKNFTIFTFNAGPGGDEYLLDLLAYRSRGESVNVAEIPTASGPLVGLLEKYNNPVMVRLNAVYGNLEVDEVYPAVLPNLYVDRPVVIYGKCYPSESIAMRIVGYTGLGRRAFFYKTKLPAPNSTNADIAKEWGRGKIHFLMSKIVREGLKPEWKTEIIRLGRKYDIPVPY